MKRLLLVFILLAIASMFTGCGNKGSSLDIKLPGKTASEYERLVDMEFWMDKFDIDELTRDMADEEKMLFDGLMDVYGYENLKQVEKKATISDGIVYAGSKIKYEGDDDDTLYAAIMNWEPGHANLIAGFDPEEAYAIIAIGNPTGWADVLLEWVTGSRTLRNFIRDIAEQTGGEDEIPLILSFIKMTLKGYWYTAQEDYYPYIGDELIFVLFENDDFVGWEDIDYADSFEDGSPVRFIIALETDKTGLADEVKDAIEYYTDLFTDMMYGSSYGYYEEEYGDTFEVQTKRADGYDIYYVDIEDVIQIGWTEYQGALFISDLETLKDLDDYYDASGPVKDVPKEFNSYMTINVDKIVEDFYDPFEDDLKEEMEWAKDYVDEDIYELYEDMFEMLDAGNLGVLKVYSVFGGGEAIGVLSVKQPMADLMLKGYDYFAMMIDKEFDFMTDGGGYTDRYFKLYGTDYKELRKTPPPVIPEPGPGVSKAPQ